jgi:hypothetical protein
MADTKLSCLLATLALGAFWFSACGGKPAGGRVRYGTVEECLASDDGFYSIAGGRDYSRLPLLRPWHILELNNDLDLTNERTSVLRGLVGVGARDGAFYGTAVYKDVEGRMTFWALSPTENSGFPVFKKFAPHEEWTAHLGFTPSPASLLAVGQAVSAFGKGTDLFEGERK